MKKNKLLLSGILYFVITTSYCQNDGAVANEKLKIKKLKVVDAAFMPGISINVSALGSLTDFQKLNPNSALLNENMEGYTSSTGFTGSAGPTVNANLGINFANYEKTAYNSSAQLRVGIAFSEITLSNSLSKSERTRFDTLTSSQTGQMVFYDSVKSSSYNMNYKTQQLRIDVSVIYRTNPAARWSVYGGIGIEGGGSILTYTDLRYSEYSTIASSNSTYGNSGYSSSPSRSERIVNKNSYGYAMYLPMGVDFRMGNKREFFKQLHLFYEARPFINNTFIPELGGLNSIGFKSGLGLRVTI